MMFHRSRVVALLVLVRRLDHVAATPALRFYALCSMAGRVVDFDICRAFAGHRRSHYLSAIMW